MPALEALVSRFARAHTQPLGLSVDSVHCHANWGQSLGGISFPLLADFHPKGAVAASYGLYLEDKGITDRATVIIDAGGVVRHASSVTPAGSRDMAELLALCEAVDRGYSAELPAPAAPPGVEKGTLYVKNACGFSRAVLLARDNLHLQEAIAVKNVSEDASALGELERLGEKKQAPALRLDGEREVLFESAAIIQRLSLGATGLGGAPEK